MTPYLGTNKQKGHFIALSAVACNEGSFREQVRAMRLTYAETDDYPSNTIDAIDAAALKKRHQVLFVSSDGNGHCLMPMVFAKSQSGFRRIWFVRTGTDGSFCRSNAFSPDPEVYAGKDGNTIIVDVPDCPVQYPEEPRYPKIKGCYGPRYTYKWTGTTFRYTGSSKVRFRAPRVIVRNP